VRYASGQLADGIHALDLSKPFFQKLPFRHIHADTSDIENVTSRPPHYPPLTYDPPLLVVRMLNSVDAVELIIPLESPL
jgi:hypothetical protein